MMVEISAFPVCVRQAGVIVEWLGHWCIVPIGAPFGIIVIYN